MRGAARLVLLAASCACTGLNPVRAESIEINQVCFDGICFESREAFMTIAADRARGHFRFRFSRTQSTLYAQIGGELNFPHCAPHCDQTEQAGEKRAFQPRTGRLVARLISDLAGCQGRALPPIMLYVYDASLNPDWLSITAECPR
jgi:hypothetical protein